MTTWQKVGELIEKHPRLEIDVSYVPALDMSETGTDFAGSDNVTPINQDGYLAVVTRRHTDDQQRTRRFRYRESAPTAAAAIFAALVSDQPRYEVDWLGRPVGENPKAYAACEMT